MNGKDIGRSCKKKLNKLCRLDKTDDSKKEDNDEDQNLKYVF